MNERFLYKGNIRVSKIQLFIFWILLFLAWLLFAFSKDNSDYVIYQNWFNYSKYSGIVDRFEFGFSILLYIAAKSGLSYQEFIAFFSAVGLIILGKCILDYSNKPLLVLILYLIYPFFFDVVQIRNFMAEVIVLFGIRFLIETNAVNLVKFSLCIGIASLFHITAIFYLLFLLSYLKSYKKILMVSMIIMFLGVAAVLIASSFINKYAVLIGNSEYLDRGSSVWKVFGYGAFGIAISFLILVYYNQYCTNRKMAPQELLFYLIPIINVSIVVIAITSQGYRLFRNMVLIIYIAFLNNCGNYNSNKITTSVVKLSLLVFAIFLALYFNYKQLSGEMFDSVVYRIVYSNDFFRFLLP